MSIVLADILSMLKKQKPEHTKDATSYHMFFPSNRYVVDYSIQSTTWEQFDTDQDAEYFGVWMNKHTQRSLTYAEGDWYLHIFNSPDLYDKNLIEAFKYYGTKHFMTVIGVDGQATRYFQDRSHLLINPSLFTKEPPVVESVSSSEPE